MYFPHFGLSQDPFSIAPDPHYLFMSERHREALAHLLFGVGGPHGTAGGSGGGFVLLSGDIGTGKTTICRCFLEQIPAGCHVAYIFNPKLSVTELMQSICEEFHISVATGAPGGPSIKDYIDALNRFLLQTHAAGQNSVLIIDEAQNLSSDVLEQLRLLTNLETHERKLLQIILIGQPELRTMLEDPKLEQLAQRVIARFHLDALGEAETQQYITHRLAIAGHTGRLPFDAQALRRIHALARGVPRRINLLCGRSLLGAWANGLHQVNAAVVNKAATEVFGTEVNSTGSMPRRRAYAWAGVTLLTGAAVAVALVLTPPLVSPQARQAPTPGRSTAPPDVLPTPGALLGGAGTTEEIETLLPLLLPDMADAWRALARAWELPASHEDPCLVARAHALECYRGSKLSFPLLRQLARPGIVTLQPDQGPPVYALLTALSPQTATLWVGKRLHTVRLASLNRWWRGDFATYWRPPAGYTEDPRKGVSAELAQELSRRLTLLDGVAAASAFADAPALDAALKERVKTFQRTQGLKPDGYPGPMTFMHLDSATGTQLPRWPTETP